jgi:hypothetical protein
MKTKLIKAIFNRALLAMGLFILGMPIYGAPEIIINGNDNVKFTVENLVILASASPDTESMLATSERGKLKVWTLSKSLTQPVKKAKISTSQNLSQKALNGHVDITFYQGNTKSGSERINLDQSGEQFFEEVGITAQVQKRGGGPNTVYIVTIQ